MIFDFIMANPPYSHIGCDITKYLLEEVPHNEISLLGTTQMLSSHNDQLAMEYVYIEKNVLKPKIRFNWVQQMIVLGWTGKCKVYPTKYYSHKEEPKPNEIRITYALQGGGEIRMSVNAMLNRNRSTSVMLSLSDKDYKYFLKHWKDMDNVDRFYWLVDIGLYKSFEIVEEK